MDAITRLLVSQAVAEITVEDICIEADVSASTFYRRFDNKDALLHALYEGYHADVQRVQAEVRQLLADSDDLRTFLLDAAHVYIEHYLDYAPLARVILEHEALLARHQAVLADVQLIWLDVVDRFGIPQDPQVLHRLEFISRVGSTLVERNGTARSLAVLMGASDEQILEDIVDLCLVYTRWAADGCEPVTMKAVRGHDAPAS